MDSPLWYLIILTGVFIVLFVLSVVSHRVHDLSSAFCRFVKIPLLIHRRRWDSMTRLDALCLGIFFSANALLIFIPFDTFDWRRTEKRCALFAAVNLLPLCAGMRLGPARILNVHRTSFHLLHHWVGRVAILEALCHAVIVVSKRPYPGVLVYTGYGVLGGFVVCLFLSLVWLRALQGKRFIFTHSIVVIGSFAVLFWHVLCVENIAAQAVIGASGILLLTCLGHSAWRMCFPNHFARIYEFQRYPQAGMVTIKASLTAPVRLVPGGYFRIAFHRTPYSRRYSAVASGSTSRDQTGYGVSKSFNFVLSSEGTWKNTLRHLNRDHELTLDGPYGQDLRLRAFEMVFLVAKGIGIAGIIPLALDLAERKHHDALIQSELAEQWANYRASDAPTREKKIMRERIAELEGRRLLDATRKVVLLWLPETNAHMEPLASELSRLKKLDPLNRLLVVWCLYPEDHLGSLPFEESEDPQQQFWACKRLSPRNAMTVIQKKVSEERGKTPGRMVVATCGDPEFTNAIRKTTLSSRRQMIDFVETEFRPAADPNLTTEADRGWTNGEV